MTATITYLNDITKSRFEVLRSVNVFNKVRTWCKLTRSILGSFFIASRPFYDVHFYLKSAFFREPNSWKLFDVLNSLSEGCYTRSVQLHQVKTKWFSYLLRAIMLKFFARYECMRKVLNRQWTSNNTNSSADSWIFFNTIIKPKIPQAHEWESLLHNRNINEVFMGILAIVI